MNKLCLPITTLQRPEMNKKMVITTIWCGSIRSVDLQPEQIYVCDPQNKRIRKNRGKECLLLTLEDNGEGKFMARVQWIDNGSVADMEPGWLAVKS